jgi:general stress protein CsbA
MILGRPVTLWNAFVAAIAAAVIAAASAAGVAVNTEFVGSVVTVALVVVALIANQAENGSILGRSKFGR